MALYAFLATVAAAGLTRVLFLAAIFKTFHGEPHDRGRFEPRMRGRSSCWCARRACGRFAPRRLPFEELFAGDRVEEFFRESLKFAVRQHHSDRHASRAGQCRLVADPHVVLGALVAWQFYIAGRTCRPRSRAQRVLVPLPAQQVVFRRNLRPLHVRPTLWLGRLLWKGGDGWLIDGYRAGRRLGRVIRCHPQCHAAADRLSYHYAFAMLIGVAAFITWFMFATGGH